MIGLFIYLVGYVLCFLQMRKNFKKIDKKWTNGNRLICILASIGSWFFWFLSLYAYHQEVKDTKFRRWLEKDLQPKDKTE